MKNYLKKDNKELIEKLVRMQEIDLVLLSKFNNDTNLGNYFIEWLKEL